ncbi:MAG: hypothetical protein PHO53_05900 [Actinomycetota bacterium]|nr:hypothetical protein [Actinomycetota bacterium]
MKTNMLLCDYAEAIEGKLYIMGGGWSLCPAGPRNMSIAMLILVPWNETNTQHKLTLMLLDEDGNQVNLGEPPREVKQEGSFEVGRPPGVPPGSDIGVALVFNFIGIPFTPGAGYRWQLEIDGQPTDYVSFRTRGS